jgi:hypothetical protein
MNIMMLQKPKMVDDHNFLRLLLSSPWSRPSSSFSVSFFSIFLSPSWQTWHTSNICSPKVVCDFQSFLAYKYIFKSEIYTYMKETQLRKSMSTTSNMKLIRISTMLSNIARPAFMFLIGMCWCVHVNFSLDCRTPTRVGMLEVCTLGTLKLQKPKTVNDHDRCM